MIAEIKGRLSHKSLEYVILEANGIGYQIFIPLSTFYKLPEPEEILSLKTYTYFREDALQLFGFLTIEEKEIFQLLIKIPGVGPKSALNILSGIALDELCQAIKEEDVAKLVLIPGIGKKTAQRITLELKDKIDKVKFWDQDTQRKFLRDEDIISALINLGYQRGIAQKALEKGKREIKKEEYTLENLLKATLKMLSR